MRIGRSAVAVCAAVCLQAGTADAQSRSLTLADVLARAREQAPQIVSARLALEEARGAAARRIPSVSDEPGDRRGSRQSQRARYSIHRLRGGSRPKLRAGCPPVRSDCRRQRGDRSKLREHRRGHTDGAPLGCLGLLPRSARERADQAAECHARTCGECLRNSRSAVQGWRHRRSGREHRPHVACARQGRTRRGGSLEGIGARGAATASASRE